MIMINRKQTKYISEYKLSLKSKSAIRKLKKINVMDIKNTKPLISPQRNAIIKTHLKMKLKIVVMYNISSHMFKKGKEKHA